MLRAQRDLTTCDRRARVLESELNLATERSVDLEAELKLKVANHRAQEQARRAKVERDAQEMALLREDVRAHSTECGFVQLLPAHPPVVDCFSHTQLEVTEASLQQRTAELKRTTAKNTDIMKRLKLSRDECEELTDKLAKKTQQHVEMKEALGAAQVRQCVISRPALFGRH